MSEHDSLQEHADAGAEHMAERQELADLEKRGQRLAEVAVAATTPTDLLALALEKGLDTETLSRFMDLQERYEATEARKAYADAMVRCQKAMPQIQATADNPQTSSRYAKLEHINAAITPIYTKHGFSISFGEGVPAKDGDIRIEARVLHKLGHTEDYFYDLPLDIGGLRGNENKTPVQAKGSSTSYARRYLTTMIFNLTIGEDLDGNGGNGGAGRITEEQALTLDALVSENELSHTAIQREFRVAGWPQLAANRFDKVHARITQLIEARNRR
jgi:hypothetical protein